MPKVCLDAGHYGKYNQSPVLKTYYESDMTWKLHNFVESELKEYGITVKKTRTSQNTDKELVARGYTAKDCDLFLSFHSNAAANSNAKYALSIIMRDNKNETYDEKSKEIGTILAKVIADVMGVTYQTMQKEYVGDRDGNGLKDDEWYGVLQGAKMAKVPGVILEHSFHTNLASAKWLSQDDNLKKLASAEAAAIANWFGIKAKKSATTAKTTKTTKTTTTAKKTKTLQELAEEVIKGKWYNGAARKSALEKAYKDGTIAYTYTEVQNRVNEVLSGKSATKVHVVVKGDTLTLIAKKYSTTVNQIAKDNDLSNPSIIYVGQKLIIR